MAGKVECVAAAACSALAQRGSGHAVRCIVVATSLMRIIWDLVARVAGGQGGGHGGYQLSLSDDLPFYSL